jgi:hypothetical protein
VIGSRNVLFGTSREDGMSKTAKRTWRERAIEYATKIMDQPENRPQVQKLAGMLIGTLEAD